MVEKQTLAKAVHLLKTPAVVMFGNPLMDFVVTLEDESILEKYQLPMDGEIEIEETKISQILADLSLCEKRITPGGCAQNTARLLQWLCGGKRVSPVVIYCGGVGNDCRGSSLDKLVKADGIQTKYAIHSTLPTGICISLICGQSRSLVANLGAASVYTLIDLKRSNLPLDGLKIIYIEGFFLTHSLDVAKEIIVLTQEKCKNIIVAFNLSGEYIFEKHQAAICEMVGLAKIVFGNAREMTALANALNIQFENVTDIPFLLNSSKRVAVSVASANIEDDWLTNNDIFVMTQGGSAPAIVVWGEGHSAQVHPKKPKEPIVDTTGAGDSLVAGFLAGVLAQWDPKSCLKCGCRTAAKIITKLGVDVPESDGI
ncbi:adenosine kinase [Fopius arisanus]|uniref:Adenosine kinase n=2 Tax=Fopius arisanus TaxID=64838 RepID=A0A9R1TYN3_9HYME|nr:PREDICTED: adenosine kinase [Fopius arisanus]XP_011300902.1 PREDICTED: adenosine kinase [Fopius arisanus]XP_011300903.1 PREDICTED: adenosine kinase [Fopius arisanus]XP_011300904.1 PREDICTED: adenosine kinase [Fopius arisanus]